MSSVHRYVNVAIPKNLRPSKRGLVDGDLVAMKIHFKKSTFLTSYAQISNT
jgi:hypothetical protein